MDITVVIPCRGHAASLPQCLRSVTMHSPPLVREVIVVDSASDDTVARVVEQFQGVRLVRSATPLQAGPARNLGVAQARGQYLAFLDADCVAESGWLHAAHAALMDPAVRLVGGPVGDLLHSTWIAAADNLLQFVDLPLSRPAGPARYFPSCNMAMRTADFLAVGGFPVTGMNAGEDILLCVEILSRWKESLRFAPGMAVRHAGRSSWEEYLRHHQDFGYARAIHRLHVRPWHLSWGRHAIMVPLMTLKRLGYVLRSGVRYRGMGAVRVVALLPLALPGLWYSALGFYQGCRDRLQVPRTVPGRVEDP
jgi:glycosyltransferase involved in cell wall biosynthesis